MTHVDTHIGQRLDWFRLLEMYNLSLLCWFPLTRGGGLLQILSERFCTCHTEPAPGITSHSVLGLERNGYRQYTQVKFWLTTVKPLPHSGQTNRLPFPGRPSRFVALSIMPGPFDGAVYGSSESPSFESLSMPCFFLLAFCFPFSFSAADFVSFCFFLGGAPFRISSSESSRLSDA